MFLHILILAILSWLSAKNFLLKWGVKIKYKGANYKLEIK